MTIQRVYTFHCPNCPDHTVLPRRSHLGIFDGQSSPAKDIWPIRYLCLYCGRPYVVHVQAIHPEVAETQDLYQLVRYDFSSVQSGSLEHYAIYTKEKINHDKHQETSKEAFERVLRPFGLASDSFGEAVNVSADRGLQCALPLSAEWKTK